MPSSVTQGLSDEALHGGKHVTLREFLLDASMALTFAHYSGVKDGKVVRRRASIKHYQEQIEEANATIERLLEMDDSAKAEAAHEDYEHALAKHERDIAGVEALLERYRSMLGEVKAWDVAEEVAYAKEYAIKHLEEMIDSEERILPYYQKPTRLDGNAWYNEKLRGALEDINHANVNITRQIEIAESFNKQIDAFNNCLPE